MSTTTISLLLVLLLLLTAIEWLQASTVLSTRTITEKQGHDVVLSCRFDRLTERDRVMWSKDGVVLSVNQEISGDRQKYEILGKYDLVIKTIASNDSGRYLCQNFDQALSMTILLTVLTRPSKPEVHQSNGSLVENTLAQFLCTTQGGNPFPTFKWFLNQSPINESLFIVHPNGRESYSELHLPLERRFHNEQLTCQVHNQALDSPLSTSTTLNIQYKPEIVLRNGQSIVTNVNLLAIENGRLSLECQVQANPAVIEPITWLKNGASMTDITSPSLILQTIKRNDEGEYTCVASNTIGRSQASVRVRVQYGPIVRLTGGGTIRENHRLALHCSADAYPLVDFYQWFKNGQKLSAKNATIIIERVSRFDAGIYTCMVKNSLKQSNGSSIEKSDRTQTRVAVEYAPSVLSPFPIIAADVHAPLTKLQCEIDANPEASISWFFRDRSISNSNKYLITQQRYDENGSMISTLIIQQLQVNSDYGFYSCNATNKLGYNSTVIQIRSKDVPETPTQLNVTSTSYSSIDLKWQPGFDGGWPQSYWVSIDSSLAKETNTSQYTLTNLQHAQTYNITVRAQNRLGKSRQTISIRVKTKDVPIRKDDLPTIEHSSFHLSQRSIGYRLNDNSSSLSKVPLCIRIDIYNRSSFCKRIVTSSGVLELNNDYLATIDNVANILNVSICLDQYEDYCGKTIPVDIKREVSFNWLFVLITSIIVVFLLILCGLCTFCLIQRRKRRRNASHDTVASSVSPSMKKVPSVQHPVVIEPIVLGPNSPNKFFSNIGYHQPEQQIKSSYSKLAEIQKIDQFKDKQPTRLIVTTINNNTGNLSSSGSSSDPILSNPNSSSLSGSDQLTVTDFYPISTGGATTTTTTTESSYKPYNLTHDLPPTTSIQNDLIWSQSQYGSYGFPFYSSTTPSNHFREIVSNKTNKEDSAESGYSTPSKTHHQSKKTVYEVVV